MLKKKKTPTFITNSIEISSDNSDRKKKTLMKKMKHWIFFKKYLKIFRFNNKNYKNYIFQHNRNKQFPFLSSLLEQTNPLLQFLAF